jgi:amino-acid N-acetyltransferase
MSAVAATSPVIAARPALGAAVALLEGAGLPAKDLTAAHLEYFFYSGAPESPSGLVGLELSDDTALLRSLVVTPEARTRGLGSMLVEHAEGYARSRGAGALYLLTTTAERFFAKRGYTRIARGAVAEAVRNSHEFKDLCPDTSALMLKPL